jgi:K+-sensing histidine kinase KdpD
MDTHFAPAPRADEDTLKLGVGYVNSHPVMSGLLRTAEGVLAILNAQRQILALNDAFLDRLGIKDAQEALGLRPGEALDCVHARQMPAGCGTSEYCSTCGAAIAIVAAVENCDGHAQRCVLTVADGAETRDMCLSVRACSIDYAGSRFIVLFLRDVTLQEERAALERVFYHDVANIAAGLQGIGESINEAPPRMRERLQEQLVKLCARLSAEISVQRSLAKATTSGYTVRPEAVALEELLAELRDVVGQHPSAYGRNVEVAEPLPVAALATDRSLLLRILLNMVTNALEHTPQGGKIRVWVEADADACTFCVQNEEVIPADIARRVFQRYFTTKPGEGHGLGAYAMKLLGEDVLGGRVSFTTDEMNGTTFRFCLPR